MTILSEEAASSIRLLQSWIESQMAYSGQPGLSVAILNDKEIIWSKGYGYADLENRIKAAPETIYRIASITKLFTSTAVMQLRDQGKLNLHDPVAEYLPWFNIKEPKGRPITVENLITHTSGLPREAAGPYWTTTDFPLKEEVVKNLPGQRHPLEPWRKWKYSNLALSLAGYIVEEVSGKPYESYVKENILKPLGMNSTYVESIPMDHPNLARGYGRRTPDGVRKHSPYTDCRGITPAANMATSVLDLARFAMLQFREDENDPVLTGETLREMHRVHWLDPNWAEGWGLGFNIQRIGGKTYIGHGGSVQGYRTNIRINLEDKVAVIVFTNADDGEPIKYVEKAHMWVAPALAEKPVSVTPGDWSRFTGKFRNAWGDVEVLLYDGELIMINPQLPDPFTEYTILKQVEGDTFQMKAHGYGSHNEYAVYEFNEEGRVERLKMGENYTYPVDEW
jgi:CubicO group peptidase (beta-lactamase class C family)